MSENKLPETFNGEGFVYAQVWRAGDWAIFSQSKYGRIVSYEVVKIRHKGARLMPNGKTVGPQESYPSPRDWGKSAWTCCTLARSHQIVTEHRNTDCLRVKEGKDTPPTPNTP